MVDVPVARCSFNRFTAVGTTGKEVIPHLLLFLLSQRWVNQTLIARRIAFLAWRASSAFLALWLRIRPAPAGSSFGSWGTSYCGTRGRGGRRERATTCPCALASRTAGRPAQTILHAPHDFAAQERRERECDGSQRCCNPTCRALNVPYLPVTAGRLSANTQKSGRGNHD